MRMRHPARSRGPGPAVELGPLARSLSCAPYTGLVFALLLAAVCGHIWFASAPLPLGGPNVLLAGLAVLGAGACFVAPVLVARRGVRAALFVSRLRGLRLIGPALATIGLTFAWAVVVSAANDNWDDLLLGKMAFGAGVLCAVFLTVDSVRRGNAFALTLLVATAFSALFGALLLLFGEPFTGLWLWLTQVPDEQLGMLLRGASSGLAGHPSVFGNQLCVAIPVALSAVAWMALLERRRWRVLGIASCYALLAVVTTMLLVNGSRSSVFGTIVGVGTVAWVWLRRAGDRRRISIVLALAVLSLVALWVGLGFLGMSAPPDAGEVRGLVAGGKAMRWHEKTVGHRFGGFEPGVRYEIGISEQYSQGRGPWTRINATADSAGDIVLAWHRSANDRILGYRFRTYPPGQRRLPSNEYVTPSLPTPMPPRVCAADREADLAVRDLTAVTGVADVAGSQTGLWREMQKRATPNMAQRVGAAVYLMDAVEHTVEVRACSANGHGPAAQTVTALAAGQPVILTWREPQNASQLEYQFRARPDGSATWSGWRMVQPARYLGGPAYGTIGVGGQALVGGPSAIGHEFRGFAHAQWFVIQIRARRGAGFDSPLEVAAKADLRGRLVLVWAEPEDPASVVGHQFRVRRAASAAWWPWRDFTPTLSSKVPVPQLLSVANVGDENRRVRRHVLTGVVPSFVYGVQMRARNEYGYGAPSEALFRAAEGGGTLPLVWRETAAPAPATGYQFRLYQNGSYQWWQDLAWRSGEHTPALTVDDLRGREDERLAFARAAHDLAGYPIVLQRRLSVGALLNTSAYTRIWQVPMAWRYTLDHPLGTGKFAPKRWHMGTEAERSFTDGTSPEEPHNQFLHMLVLFGVPGLALQIAFYVVVARGAVRCARIAARQRSAALRFLSASAVGACAAYFAGSLLLPYGPLLHDWDHFFVVGLLFSVLGIAARALDE